MVQNGVNVLSASDYIGRASYSDLECSAIGLTEVFFPDLTIASDTIYTNTTCDSTGTRSYSEYLLKTSRYQYVPITSTTDPCSTPSAVAHGVIPCFGRNILTGELGFFIVDENTNTYRFTLSVYERFDIDSNHRILICE